MNTEQSVSDLAPEGAPMVVILRMPFQKRQDMNEFRWLPWRYVEAGDLLGFRWYLRRRYMLTCQFCTSEFVLPDHFDEGIRVVETDDNRFKVECLECRAKREGLPKPRKRTQRQAARRPDPTRPPAPGMILVPRGRPHLTVVDGGKAQRALPEQASR